MATPTYEEYQKQWKDQQSQIDNNINTLNGTIAASGSKYVRNPMNTSQLMLVQTGTDIKSQIDTRKAIQSLDPILNPSEDAALGTPYGTTQSQAIGKTPMTIDQQNRIVQSRKATKVLDQIEKYSKLVNNFSVVARPFAGLGNWVGAKTQINKNAALFESQKAKLSNVIRALGETGNLAEGDVSRGVQMLPSLWDTKDVAQQKIADLRELLASGSSTGATSDPLGIMGQ